MTVCPCSAPAGRTVNSLVASGNFTCAVLDDGSIACWGDNTHGQLGIGSTASVGTAPGQMGSNLTLIDLGPGVRFCSSAPAKAEVSRD
jgi:alpha-tubulin suppressor-like RCC1 family protein